MNILKHKARFFNRTLSHVPKQLHHLYTFGFWSLTGERVSSMRGNARQVVDNPHTAKTKAWRLLKNRRWQEVIPQLLTALKLVTSSSIVCLDFSDYHGWQVLTFAFQTRSGRAIPVFFDLIRYPITENSQNIFITTTIEKFVAAVGCRPKLVMDRGFACPHIIEYLTTHSHPFVVRIKGGKHVQSWQRRRFAARNTGKADQPVRVYNQSLRLVISDNPGNGNEPWYLITNDCDNSRKDIIQQYYYRFEIEEFFKDAKWLYGLEWVRFLKSQSMAIVLWFVLLGMWFTALMETTAAVGATLLVNNHELSATRRVYEATQRELRRICFRSQGLKLPGLCI